MDTENTRYSRALSETLRLRFAPVAVKMIEDEAQIPARAVRPARDMGAHLALCQAFALARREKKTVYMSAGDHWCWNPLIGLGHTDASEGSEAFDVVCKYLGIRDEAAAREFFARFPRFPRGQYLGIVTAPLSDADFTPDVTLVYANNAQLRSMIWAVKSVTGRLVSTQLDAIDSCVYCIVPPMLDGEYRVTLPDIGEFERAGAGEDEIILSVPRGRLGELTGALRTFFERRMGYEHFKPDMKYDFARPPFYDELFKLWGLEPGEARDR